MDAAGMVPVVGGKGPGGKDVAGIGGSRKNECSNSFAPDTLVLLADGSTKKIAEVSVGDIVIAADPITGETSAVPVITTISGNGIKDLAILTIDVDGAIGTGTADIVATANHPFWSPASRRWAEARDFAAADLLESVEGRQVRVTAIALASRPMTVYNLTVGDLHTYFVVAGDVPVLVHNCLPMSRWVVRRVTLLEITRRRIGSSTLRYRQSNVRSAES
jgi:hypothetical protein